MRAKEAKLLVGKKVRWKAHYDPNRGTYCPRSGVVDEVKGKNIRIDDDWKWLPDLFELEVVEE